MGAGRPSWRRCPGLAPQMLPSPQSFEATRGSVGSPACQTLFMENTWQQLSTPLKTGQRFLWPLGPREQTGHYLHIKEILTPTPPQGSLTNTDVSEPAGKSTAKVRRARPQAPRLHGAEHGLWKQGAHAALTDHVSTDRGKNWFQGYQPITVWSAAGAAPVLGVAEWLGRRGTAPVERPGILHGRSTLLRHGPQR